MRTKTPLLTMDPNSVLWIDEPHLLADVYGEPSIRQRTLSNGFSLLRKMGVRVIFSTVHEERTARSLKAHIQTMVYPRRYRPSTKPKFPPWCYLRMTLIGPNPFAGRRLSDEWGIPRPQGDCRVVERPPIPPLDIYETAKLIDSWEKPDILEGIRTSAQDIKNSVGQMSQAQTMEAEQVAEQALKETLATAINSGFDFGQHDPRPRPIFWQKLLRVARQYGWQGNDKEGRTMLRILCGYDSQYRVKITDLMDLFVEVD